MQAIALGLALPEDRFEAMLARPMSSFRLIHYPPQAVRPPAPDETGCGAHSDYGCLTILAQDAIGGLEIQTRDGRWIDAPPIPGSFVLNVGDMLARWTNHRFVSTPHRVVNRSGGDRYSLPYFFDPAMDAMIECLPGCAGPGNPPRYETMRYGDYLMERLDKNYNYRMGRT